MLTNLHNHNDKITGNAQFYENVKGDILFLLRLLKNGPSKDLIKNINILIREAGRYLSDDYLYNKWVHDQNQLLSR